MVKTVIKLAIGLAAALSAQTPSAPPGDRTDLYFGDWRSSPPRTTHGTLVERDILTRGDPLNSPRKGAVLRFLNSYTFATLAPHTSARPTKLEGQQEILYIASGRGSVAAGGETAELYRNVAVLMPAQLEFTLKNDDASPLTFYLVNEPTQPGFRPNSKMLVKDENTLPITSSSGFWDHVVKTIFVSEDGLSTVQSFLTVTLDPLTIARPHLVQQEDIEEIWTGLDGTSVAFIGTQLRRQTPGMAYIHPPDHKTPHANINYSEEEQVKFLYIARYHPHENRK